MHKNHGLQSKAHGKSTNYRLTLLWEHKKIIIKSRKFQKNWIKLNKNNTIMFRHFHFLFWACGYEFFYQKSTWLDTIEIIPEKSTKIHKNHRKCQIFLRLQFLLYSICFKRIRKKIDVDSPQFCSKLNKNNEVRPN